MSVFCDCVDASELENKVLDGESIDPSNASDENGSGLNGSI